MLCIHRFGDGRTAKRWSGDGALLSLGGVVAECRCEVEVEKDDVKAKPSQPAPPRTCQMQMQIAEGSGIMGIHPAATAQRVRQE